MKRQLGVLLRWSWLLVLFVILGYVGGKVAASVLPPQYEAVAIVQLNAQSHSSGLVQPVDAYSSDITSNAVLDPIFVKYPSLDRTTFTTKQLVLVTSTQAQTITIDVTLPNKVEAAAIANQLADTMVKQQNAYIQSQYTKQIQILNTRINNEQQEINHLNQEIINTPTTNVTLIQQYQGQVDQQRSLQNQDITSLQTAETDQTLYSAPLTVVQSAAVPTKPSSIVGSIPIMPVVMLIIIVLGLFIVFLLEQAANRITDMTVLQQKMEMPILGTLNWTRPGPESLPLARLADMDTPYAEQCRTMMANTLFYAEENEARTIVLIGSRPKAGTSSIAAGLAVLLAQSQRRVLLIDANLHAPSLHKRLGLPNEMGLAKMLQEARMAKASLAPTHPSSATATGLMESFPVDSYIQPTNIQGLYFVPAGKTTISPSALLSMTEMKLFTTWASKRADFVIIDSPAAEFAESHILGTLGDTALLAADATKDRVKKLALMKDELVTIGVKLTGVVVNKLDRLI